MNLNAELLKSEDFKGMVRHWWQSLADDRGQRAELCRCRNWAEVYISSAYRDHLAAQMQASFALDEKDLERLALPAGVLARVRTLESGVHFATLFARHGGGSPAMRDVRFRRLLAIPDGKTDELFTMLVRLVRLMDNAAALSGLLEAGRFWNDQTRIRWAKEYYPHRAQQPTNQE